MCINIIVVHTHGIVNESGCCLAYEHFIHIIIVNIHMLIYHSLIKYDIYLVKLVIILLLIEGPLKKSAKVQVHLTFWATKLTTQHFHSVFNIVIIIIITI